MRRISRLLVVVAAMWMAAPSVALAHAGLEETDPVAGSYVEVSPETITLTFDERVITGFGSLRVLDAEASELVDLPLRPGATNAIAVADLDSQLRDGAYVVLWRVTSSDGHPVQGSFTFSVGETNQTIAADVAASAVTEHGLSRLFVVIRASMYLAFVLLVGVISLMWRRGGQAVSVRAAILTRGSWFVLVVASAQALVAFGPHAAGVKIYRAFDGELLRTTLDTTFGRAQVVRLVLLLALWPMLTSFVRGARQRFLLVAIAALAVTVSVSGHAISTSPVVLGVGSDAVHLLAIGAWIGGLFALVLVTRERTRSNEDQLALADGFSRIARWALPIVVVTGAIQTWLLVGDVTEILDTQYGRSLVVKFALVAVVVALSGTARSALRRRDASSLRATIAFEAIIAVVIIALTASLTGLSPKTVSAAGPYQETVVSQDVFVTLAVTPARVGSSEVHLIMSRAGGVIGELTDVELRIGSASMNLPMGPVPLIKVAPNHYTARITFAFAGTWTAEVLANPRPYSVSRFAFDVPISE